MNLRPLIGWLVMATVIAGLLLPSKNIMFALVATASALYILDSATRRYTLLLLPFAVAGILASQFSLPLPATWPGLMRLALTLGVWLLITVGLTVFILSALNDDTTDVQQDSDEEE